MGAKKASFECNAFMDLVARVTCYEAGNPAQRRVDVEVGIYACLSEEATFKDN